MLGKFLLPCFLRLCNQVLPLMDSMVFDLLVVCFLKCSAMGNAVEDTGKERRVPDNLQHRLSNGHETRTWIAHVNTPPCHSSTPKMLSVCAFHAAMGRSVVVDVITIRPLRSPE